MIGIECTDTRECFAKNRSLDGVFRCSILSGGYPGDTCPFRKAPGAVKPPEREELEKVKSISRSRKAEERNHESPD